MPVWKTGSGRDQPHILAWRLVATMALARKLAAWFWRVMVKGDDYVEQGLAHYDAQVLQSKQRALKRLAKELGRKLVPIVQPA